MNPLEWIAGGGRAGGERKTKRKDLRGKSEGVGGEGWTRNRLTKLLILSLNMLRNTPTENYSRSIS